MESRCAKLVRLAKKSYNVEENTSLLTPVNKSLSKILEGTDSPRTSNTIILEVTESPSTSNIIVQEVTKSPSKSNTIVQEVTKSPSNLDAENVDDFSGSDLHEYIPPSTNRNSSSSDDSSSTTSSSSENEYNHINIAAHEASTASHELSRETEALEHTEPKKSKKRIRNPNKWKRNVAKRLKNTGQEYISRTGKYIKEKKMGPVCSFKCRLSCRNKLSEEERQSIFDSYWELGELQRQRDFLSSCSLLCLDLFLLKLSHFLFRFVLTMYYFAVSKLNINSITYKYLIRGHTQNEGDTAHSIIEKCIKRVRKSGPIFVPDQYINILRKAKKSGNHFVVNEMNYNNFIDLKALAEELNTNFSKNINGEQIKLSELKVVRFITNKNTFEYKLSYKTVNMLEANIIIEQRYLRATRSNKSIDEIHLVPAYNSKIPLSERKKQDILQLIEKNIVPSYYAGYYRNL